MIKVTFTDEIEIITSTEHLYQWDVGQVLEIGGLTNIGTPMVHFGVKGDTTGYAVQSQIVNGKLRCGIPDIVLQSGKQITAYIYVSAGASKYTDRVILIPVVERSKPSNYTTVNMADVTETQSFFDDVVDRIEVLEARMNTFTSLPEGSTSADAEIIDARIGADGVVYDNLGEHIRTSTSGLAKRMNNQSFYSLDVVKNNLGLIPIFEGDIEFIHTNVNGQYVYVTKTFNAEPGNYIIIVDDLLLSNVGFIQVRKVASGSPKYTPTIITPGVYEFTITETDDNTQTILFQISTATTVEAGLYYARGIHIYKGSIGKQALPDNLTGADKRLPIRNGKNLFNKETITSGHYIDVNGLPVAENPAYPGYYYSDYIRVEPNENYALTIPYLGGAFVSLYDLNKNPILSHIWDGNKGSVLVANNYIVTTPSNACYMRISGRVIELDQTQVEKGETQTPVVPYTEYEPLSLLDEKVKVLENGGNMKHNTVDIVESATISDGGSISISSPNSKRGNSIGFNGSFGSFGTLTISHGKTNPYCSAYMVLTGEELKVYSYTTQPILESTFTHNINLSGNVIVDITTEYKKAHIRISSNGETFETDCVWNGSNGDIKADVSGMTMTECVLTYYIQDLNKSVWCFGDSYFDHWCKYVDEYGYNGVMLDSFSGRDSLKALSSLNKCLEKATPKKIVWFMGMNDNDSSTTVNANWLSCYNSLVSICEDMNIELILSTVPTTPTNNNNFKNEIVKNSGYRYIDIAHCVGADVSSAWYDGLLSSDNVHATELGQRVMANYILAMLPEMKQEG